MARLRPPQYPVDETEVGYIPRSDDAWDNDRWTREARRMDDPADHPVSRYFAAEFRASLETPHTFTLNGPDPDKPEDGREVVTASAGDYVDLAKRPERWWLRRIDELDYLRRIVPHVSRGAYERAQEEAVRLGLVKCEDGPRLDCTNGGEVSDRDIRAVIREGILGELGWTIIHMSRPLTDAEKKQSAS